LGAAGFKKVVRSGAGRALKHYIASNDYAGFFDQGYSRCSFSLLSPLGAVAIPAFGTSLASLVTGISYWRPNTVKRTDDPLPFWVSVMTHLMMALCTSGMIVAIAMS
jgi:hypothetical protein